MSFIRWDHNVHGCWESPNFLQSRPGVLVVWVGNDAPKKVVLVKQADNLLTLAIEANGTLRSSYPGNKIWYSAIYTESLSPDDRSRIIDRINSQESTTNEIHKNY